MAKKRKEVQARELPSQPYTHEIAVATLSRARPRKFDLSPKEDERNAIADFLGLVTLSELRLKGQIRAAKDDDWHVDARLTARLEQPCVISLQPVSAYIDLTVTRDYLAEPDDEDAIELDLELDEEDPDFFTDKLDIGHLMTETLALSLEPYPRASDAELSATQSAPEGATPLDDDAMKPFAGLAALRDKLGGT